MKATFTAALLCAAMLATSTARADDVAACAAKIAPTTTVIAVDGGAVANFSPDGDADSLEIVFMTAPGEGRVSDDGQVIYVSPAATYEEQQAQFRNAFELRARIKVQSGSC